MFILYITYHDDASFLKADYLSCKWKSSIIKVILLKMENSMYFENQIYDVLLKKKEEWKSYYYIAIVSYSIEDKLESFSKKQVSINWENIFKKSLHSNLDIVGMFNVQYVKQDFDISMIEGSTFQHGLNFVKSWESLLRKLGYNDEEIFDTTVNTFFCNWWFCKPLFMLKYLEFFKIVKDTITNNKDIKYYMEKNAFYRSGKLSSEELTAIFQSNYYKMYPFILERLPCFYFHFLKNKEIKDLRLEYLSKFKLQI